uniref:Uncharacterized protein n=1 Tax=Panagrolaimus sp. ES5 TaxID=591445 RepID=A0AC34GDC6_9BILA
METEIVQNVEIESNRTKILKLAMKLDQLFLSSPSIEDSIKYEMLPGKYASDPWGPLCDFMHIVAEYNIPTFWALSTTPGKKTSCLITDHIKEMSKGNDMIKKTLLLETPCAQTWEMANRMLQIHLDIPSPTERINLQSMQLPNLDMTFHQYQLVAAAYYATTSISCRRLRDMFGNYPASNFMLSIKNGYMKLTLNRAKNISADRSTQYCIDWWSGEVAKQMNSSAEYVQHFNKIFWNLPFGSFYNNIVYLSCQKDVLKKNAPKYFP